MEYYAYNIIKELYFPGQSDLVNNEAKTLSQYIHNENPNNKGLQIPDRITNINGHHNHKLISAKDIDWDNILFPNSALDDTSWGSFDERRRWGNGRQIKVNNVYELMNMVDYLLCACEELWGEINKLKYGEIHEVEIWFVANAGTNSGILKFNRLSNNDFRKSVDVNNRKINCTYLSPNKYYSTIDSELFGIGSTFYTNDEDRGTLKIRRQINSVGSRNGRKAWITEDSITEPTVTTKQNIDGIMVDIFGYSINGDLHLFPGFYVDNFINTDNTTTNIDSLIDFKNKKLKYEECYFKISSGKYVKVYCEFLYSDPNLLKSEYINTTTEYDEDKYWPPFILYYLQDNIKYIIYISFPQTDKDGNEAQVNIESKYGPQYVITRQNIISRLTTELINNQPGNYINLADTLSSNFGDVIHSVVEQTDGSWLPYIYKINDETSTIFTIITPTTTNNQFTETREAIELYYYKSENNIALTIYTSDENNEVQKSEDFESVFSNCISYYPQRYNFPESTDIHLKVTAPWIYNENNPTEYKIDDEFIDIPLYKYNEHAANYASYYYYNTTDGDKRLFTQFTSQEQFLSHCRQYSLIDMSGTSFAHVYQKIKDPYKISYNVSLNDRVIQEVDRQTLSEIMTSINNPDNHYLYNENGYDIVKFKYSLPNNVESIKFDLTLSIKETQKVKGSSYVLPVAVNKMHHPEIHYVNHQEMDNEISQYNDNAYIYQKITKSSAPYEYEEVTLGSLYNEISKYGSNHRKVIDVVEKIYSNTIATGEIDSHFYDNTLMDNKPISFTYDNGSPNVCLIGSSYLVDVKNAGSFNKTMKFGDTSIEGIAYIFNIVGLGPNYRLHGANILYQESKHSQYFDILGNGTLNRSNNLCYFLGVGLDDRNGGDTDIRLGYISYTGSEDPYVKNRYNLIYNLHDENGSSENIAIKTNIIDIEMSTYSMSMDYVKPINGAIPAGKSGSISYNISTVNMKINNSCFYPPVETRPSREGTIQENMEEYPSLIYDFNESEDVTKLRNYIKSWAETNTSNYHPITLSLKYMENNYRNTPYFYESEHTTKMKFNVLRSNKVKSLTFASSGSFTIAMNEPYYLTTFINCNNGENNVKDNLSCGSYIYYNYNSGNFDINEIYENVLNDNTTNSDCDIYGTTQYDPSSIQVNVAKPILKDINGKYIYNINKLCGLNKIITSESLYTGTTFDKGVNINAKDIFSLKINNGILDEYERLKNDDIPSMFVSTNSNNIVLNPLSITLQITGLYGNQKYTDNIVGSNPNIQIVPIYRIQDPNHDHGLNYVTRTFEKNGVTQTFEFFEYKSTAYNDKGQSLNYDEDYIRFYEDSFREQWQAFREYKIYAQDKVPEDDNDEEEILGHSSQIYIDEE